MRTAIIIIVTIVAIVGTVLTFVFLGFWLKEKSKAKDAEDKCKKEKEGKDKATSDDLKKAQDELKDMTTKNVACAKQLASCQVTRQIAMAKEIALANAAAVRKKAEEEKDENTESFANYKQVRENDPLSHWFTANQQVQHIPQTMGLPFEHNKYYRDFWKDQKDGRVNIYSNELARNLGRRYNHNCIT